MEEGTPADRLRDMLVNDPKHEPIHEHGCVACDIAFEVVGMLAPVLDPDGRWDATAAPSGFDNDSVYRQCERVVAHVLHRRLRGRE